MSKRQRRANYSQEENLFLADKYEEYKDIVDAKHKDANTNKKKKAVWEAIFSQHKARFEVERSLDDLKSRLSKLKSEAKDRLLSAKKDKKVTGGGKPAKEQCMGNSVNGTICGRLVHLKRVSNYNMECSSGIILEYNQNLLIG